MLTELCQELRNWFERDRYYGTFTIENGALDVSQMKIQDGQFFRIIGSVFNDGVHQYKVSDMEQLTDEVFVGAIWTMAVPPAVISLSEQIQEWNNKYGSVVSSPYQSESFGGYSYTKASAGKGTVTGNNSPTWRSTFASDLNKWRKI